MGSDVPAFVPFPHEDRRPDASRVRRAHPDGPSVDASLGSHPNPIGPRVLLVGTDRALFALLHRSLRAHGFRVADVRSGDDALRRAHASDVVVIDVDPASPEIGFVEILREELPELGFVFLTEDEDVQRTLSAYDLGADGCLPKPFVFAELAARLRVVVRHRQVGGPLSFGDLVVDVARGGALRDGVWLPLSTLDFDLLALFATHPLRLWSREAILRRVWGAMSEELERTVDDHVSILRQTLADDPSTPTFVQTVRGRGYRWIAVPDSAPPEAPVSAGIAAHTKRP